MAEELENQQEAAGPSTDIQRPAQFPTATRIEDGVAYDISGKKLGTMSDEDVQPAQPVKPKFDPSQPIGTTSSAGNQPAESKPKFDPSQPTQAVAAPAKKPAFRPVDENYAGHNFDPLDLGDWRKAYFGPTTMAGQAPTPEMQKEASGVSDIFHGDIRKGLEKIAESNSMHIVQGSPIEKLIQQVNPSFKGAVDQNFVDANTRREAPMVDAAQFIDKGQHPAVKALTEVAQSLTTPANTAIMIGTGGLGMVTGPGLGVANKLLSAGFTAQALGQAYRNLEGFKKAYDEGNSNEAIYQLTHAIANGTMGYLAGSHAAGVETPLVGNLEKRAVGAVIEPVKAAAANVGAKMGFGEDFETLIKKTSPPSKGKAVDYGENVKAAAPFLKDVLNKNPNIETPKDFVEAIEGRRKAIDQQMLDKASAVRGTPEAEMPDIEGRVDRALDAAFDKEGARYKDSERDAAKAAVKNFLLQDETVNGETTLKQPDLFDVEKIRQRFNDDTRPQFGQDPGTIPPATNFAKKIAANEMRTAIDEKYGDLGIEGVKEWRQLESNLIPVRDQLELAQKKSEEMGDFSLLHSAIKNLGWPVVLGVLGHGPIGVAGGLAVEAFKVGQDYITDRVKNPNTLIRRAGASAEEAGPQTPAIPTSRENTGLHADLATHYGEPMGQSDVAGLEDRFLRDIAIKQKNRVPLEPAEKTLLGKVNGAKVEEVQARAEEQKKAAEKAAQEAEKERQEKEKLGLKTNLTVPFESEPHIHPDDEFALQHEIGHHFQIAKAGHPTHDIIGRLHDQIDSGAEAEARWHPEAFLDDKGNLKLDYLRDNIGSLLDIFHGGPVADEVMNGVPVHKNAGALTDLRRARTKLIEAGFTPSEAGQLMAASEARVRKDFTSPGVRDIFQRYSQARESGLEPGLLMNPETSGRAIQEFKDALEGTNETNNEPTPAGKAGRSNKQSKPGGAGGVPPGGKGGARPASPPREGAGSGEGNERELRVNLKDKETPKITDIIPELKGHADIEQKIKDLGFEKVLQKEYMRQHAQQPKIEPALEAKLKPGVVEKSTGSAEDDAAIKQGGGVPAGTMFSGPEAIRMFHDPSSGTTLGFRASEEITPESVKAKLDESRKAYGLKTNLAAQPERFSDDTAEKYFEDQNNTAHGILDEYNKSLTKGGKQTWSLVSAKRAKKIWSDYSKLGFVRDEVGINKMADTVLENIHKINVNNILTGHSQESPELYAGDILEQKLPEGHFDKNFDFFDDENGTPRISDYATEKLNAAAGRLYEAKTPEQKLQILDHIFNIVHARSDLSSWFIEGGKKSLNDIAGRTEEDTDGSVHDKHAREHEGEQ